MLFAYLLIFASEARFARILYTASCEWVDIPKITIEATTLTKTVLSWTIGATNYFETTNYELQRAAPNYTT